MTRSEVQVPHRPPVQGMLFCFAPRSTWFIVKFMVLSGEAIKKGIKEGILGIIPFSEAQVEQAHVNLHLGFIDGVEESELMLKPKGFVVARTLERIRLPATLCGLIEGRSKLAQAGISVEQSSKFIEPGSNNTMILEIFNASDVSVKLKVGQKIAKMVIMKITDEI